MICAFLAEPPPTPRFPDIKRTYHVRRIQTYGSKIVYGKEHLALSFSVHGSKHPSGFLEKDVYLISVVSSPLLLSSIFVEGKHEIETSRNRTECSIELAQKEYTVFDSKQG